MNSRLLQFSAHFILIIGVLIMVVPIWIAFASSTHENSAIITEGMKWGIGDKFFENYNEVLNR